MSWLPTLRRKTAVPVVTGAVYPSAGLEQKALLGSYYGALASSMSFGERSREWSVEQAVRQGYERIIWVFKAVNRISADSSKLPFMVMEGEAEVEDHPLTRLLNDGQANPLETGRQFRKRLSAQVLLSRRGAFVEVTQSNAGTPIRLDLLPPGRTKIVPGAGDNLVDHFEVTSRTGEVKRLDPATVRWFRDPHPIEPYSGVTALGAMGLSIELDHFARLYNVSFMRNDGRPGGVLAVNPPTTAAGVAAGDVDDKILDRIEERFKPGPTEAGKISVVTGALTYTDLAHSPRDLQYAETSATSKREILAGFGVSETVLGYSADRTFSNAEQETTNYWTITMDDHNGLIVTGFNQDSEDGLRTVLDTSGIEVLQRTKRQALSDARDEVAAGLRSIYSYAKLAGLEDEIDSTPHTRALWFPNGKQPIPATAEDAEALSGEVDGGAAAPAPTRAAGAGGVVAPLPADTGSATPTGTDVSGTIDTLPGAPAAGTPAATPTSGVVAAPRMGARMSPGAMDAALVVAEAATAATMASTTPTVVKSAGRPRLTIVRDTETKAAEKPSRVAVADEATLDQVEADVAAALTVVAERWVERTAARLVAPKARKGTRHWEPEYTVDTRVGTKALDSPRMADEEQWAEEAREAVEPIVAAAAAAAAGQLVDDVDAGDAYTTTQLAGLAATTVAAVVASVVDAARNQAERMSALINDLDQQSTPLDTIVTAVRDRAGSLLRWAKGLAATAATGAVNGARDETAQRVVEDGHADIDRQWFARINDKTPPRDTHKHAHKQIRPLGTPFVVGDALLRFPGDPLGPAKEVKNCRCRVAHRYRATGQFVAKPA